MITVNIKYFAMCRDVTRRDAETMKLSDGASVGAFWDAVIAAYPALEKYRSQSRVAVNLEYAGPALVLKNGDEVCIVPPVSGG